MAAPPITHHHQLQNMLQTAVQSVQWTYSLFWQLCPHQGILVWGDGYYNGAIKTRKTIQPVEVSTEEASLQRSQQLRELYDSLSAGDSNQPAKRPSAALSPEDLTESEWYYLMCVSFSFPLGVGLPGEAYVKRQHIWFNGAHETDSKVFTRAILAKSAQVQTVVCIPVLDGVVELGTTCRVEEDVELIQLVKNIFMGYKHIQFSQYYQTPKPTLSEHSTSNPLIPHHHATATATAETPGSTASQLDGDGEDEDDEDEDEGGGDEDGGGGGDQTSRAVAEASEVVLLDMSEDMRLGSPPGEHASINNNVEYSLVDHFHTIGQSRSTLSEMLHPSPNNFQPPPTGAPALDELPHEDTHYSQTVSTILHHQSSRRSSESSSTVYPSYSSLSAFTSCIAAATLPHYRKITDGTSQWLLKQILFTVPFLHSKSHDGTPARKTTAQEDLSANHVLAERRRREKLNERFIVLRSLVPFVTKMDKASILGDTIEYVKQLRKKIQDLETRVRDLLDVDRNQRLRSDGGLQRAIVDKRKMRIVEAGGGGARAAKTVEAPPQTVEVEVSIIESDGLVEMKCPYREGLLLDVMQKLREYRIEITTVQWSCINGGVVAELRAKVKENVSGKKVSIIEVKKAIKQLIPMTYN